ncbi:hypothetical protein MIR68_010864 [Amoeboaphelidium protococcarum]|nr:hypothetical protein MIR68_010864 [Amoeboaphelidium protococcarum]
MSTFLLSKRMSSVLAQRNGSLQTVTLNRPKALNALNVEMIGALRVELEHFQNNRAAQCLLLKGEGRAFCAGGDVKAVVTAAVNKMPNANQFFAREYYVNHMIGTQSKPIVALLNGITMGGGVGLSVHAPIRVATENSVFAMPETAIGLFPDVGGSFFLPRLDGKLGLYLALTGARLKAQDLVWAGIATHYVPSVNLPLLEERLQHLNSDNPEVISDAIEEFSGELSYGQYSLQKNQALSVIDKCFSYESIFDTVENLQKDGSEFAQQTLQTMMKMSPMSLHITTRQMREGKELDFLSCFEMEYTLASRTLLALQGGDKCRDFYEGVRALLIDKDNKPQWNPKSLQDIKPEDVDWFFKELGNDDGSELQTSSEATFDAYPFNFGLPSEFQIELQFDELPTASKKKITSLEDLVEEFKLRFPVYKRKHGAVAKLKHVLAMKMSATKGISSKM